MGRTPLQPSGLPRQCASCDCRKPNCSHLLLLQTHVRSSIQHFLQIGAQGRLARDADQACLPCSTKVVQLRPIIFPSNGITPRVTAFQAGRSESIHAMFRAELVWQTGGRSIAAWCYGGSPGAALGRHGFQREASRLSRGVIQSQMLLLLRDLGRGEGWNGRISFVSGR